MTSGNPRKLTWSSGLISAANVVAAGAFGWFVADAAFGAAAAGLVLLVVTGPGAMRRVRAAMSRRDPPRALSVAAGALKVAALPFVLAAAFAVSMAALAVGLVQVVSERWGLRFSPAAIALPRLRLTKGTRTRPARPLTAENISLFIANGLLLIVIGCLVYGMEVAFYAALVATPVWLCVLVAVALQASEPDRSVPLPDDTP